MNIKNSTFNSNILVLGKKLNNNNNDPDSFSENFKGIYNNLKIENSFVNLKSEITGFFEGHYFDGSCDIIELVYIYNLYIYIYIYLYIKDKYL